MTQIILRSTAPSGHVPHYRTPTAQGAAVVASGCSTTDPMFQGYVEGGACRLARDANDTDTGYLIDKSTIPGSDMHFRSENPPGNGEPDPWSSMDGYDVLLIADNPGAGSTTHPGIVLQWAEKAWAEEAEFIIWNPQSPTDQGESLEAFYAYLIGVHEGWQDEVNAKLPVGMRRCRLIPGANIYRQMYRDQVNGVAPTATWYDDLYLPADVIHMGDRGSYITSMCVAACLWGVDPFDMPDGLPDLNSGSPFPDAAYMKTKVSAGVKAYSRSGVDTSGWA